MKKLKLLAVILLTVFCYNTYLNTQIKVVEVEVPIKHLPEAFENFTILQLTDLHNQTFGKNQRHLLKKINQSSYDVLVLTGDMGDNDDVTYTEPLEHIIEGLTSNHPVLFVEGNHAPFLQDELGNKTDIANWLHEHDVNTLETPLQITRDNQTLTLAAMFEPFKTTSAVKHIQEKDVLIGLTHYPLNAPYYNTHKETLPPYDLVVAGHYHGGDVRIPFFGAIFVPNILGSGWFLDQSEVKGLKQYGEVYQYVSAGLGTSFVRVFNQPEINVIKLVSK